MYFFLLLCVHQSALHRPKPIEAITFVQHACADPGFASSTSIGVWQRDGALVVAGRGVVHVE